jgi:fibro-slime domain-containing protein
MNARLSSLLFIASLAGFGCSASGDGAGPGGNVGESGAGGASGASGGTTGIPTSGTGGSGAAIDPGMPPADPECDSLLDVVYRDFTEAHPDFEEAFRGDVVRRGLVAPDLGADQKPVFLNNTGCPAEMTTPLACANWTVTMPTLSTAGAFAEWYTDTPSVNVRLEKQMQLSENPAGSGEYVFDTSEFFPLQPSEGQGPSPVGHYTGRNYLFTTEIHVKFGYRAGQRFTFRGDDDLWIFVNGKLALDLGSLHGPEQGTIDFDAQAAMLAITPGQTYSMDIFHAERHTDGSNFRITTNIACFTDVVVR